LTTDEVEEVFQNKPRIQRIAKGHYQGEDVHAAWGRTDAGRYLIKNGQDFRYSNVFRFNAATQHQLSSRFDLIAEINGRTAGFDNGRQDMPFTRSQIS
jgi:hypothetical protein